ncbi:MAG: hypothetical protein WBE36_02280 [Terracidiphilus sp.]
MRFHGNKTARTIAAALVMLSLAVPAFSKTKDIHAVKGVYPVSCDDLWAAVKDTVHNHDNYGLSAVNDLDLRASFIVIGDRFLYDDKVALLERNGGCEMKMDIGDIGAENTNFRQFRSRVEHSLTRQEAAKAKEPPHTPGTSKSTLPVHQ